MTAETNNASAHVKAALESLDVPRCRALLQRDIVIDVAAVFEVSMRDVQLLLMRDACSRAKRCFTWRVRHGCPMTLRTL